MSRKQAPDSGRLDRVSPVASLRNFTCRTGNVVGATESEAAPNPTLSVILMSPLRLLRLEGALVFLAATGAYGLLGTPWWLFLTLLLAPDVFMIGYLPGPRTGALLYNLGHTYLVPLILGALAFGLGTPILGAIALIWTAHIGMDRALGYGLKRPSGFNDTHLSREPTTVPHRTGTETNRAPAPADPAVSPRVLSRP